MKKKLQRTLFGSLTKLVLTNKPRLLVVFLFLDFDSKHLQEDQQSTRQAKTSSAIVNDLNAVIIGCALDQLINTFFWNFQKCQAVLYYILVDKQMSEKVFCSKMLPP